MHRRSELRALFPDAAATCKGGACSVEGFPGGAPFLVVAIPRDFPGLGGVTMPLPANYATLRPKNLPDCEVHEHAGERRVRSHSAAHDFGTGSLQVRSPASTRLWPPNGLRPNSSRSPSTRATALPVTVTFEMLWKDPASGQYMLARKLGIALDDVRGHDQHERRS